MNTALSSFVNPLAPTTAGILSSAAHQHCSLRTPRQIRHIKAHPERDQARLQNPTPLDKAIFLADAIAGNTTTKFNGTYINHIPHTLILDDIMSEILPMHEWHLRSTDDLAFPVLDLPWKYHHEAQLKKYLSDRDAYAAVPSQYWSNSALEFAATVHPISASHSKSYWHAARRTLLIFDWLGHGHGQTKRAARRIQQGQTIPTASLGLFPLCARLDDQEHTMLACTNPRLTPIRQQAKRDQSAIATKLKQEYRQPLDQYFIDQLTHAS